MKTIFLNSYFFKLVIANMAKCIIFLLLLLLSSYVYMQNIGSNKQVSSTRMFRKLSQRTITNKTTQLYSINSINMFDCMKKCQKLTNNQCQIFTFQSNKCDADFTFSHKNKV